MYFNPRDDGTVHHSRLLRYDTQADFKDPAAWEAHDAQLPHSGQGLAFDGQYLYFCPGYTRSSTGGLDDENSGHILRYDTRAPLKDSASYAVFNAQQLHPEAACFDGAAFDGRHIYFAPLTSGHVLRYAVAGDFADPQSWDLYDARPLGMQMNVGAVFDGRHIYFCSYGNSTMLRYDTAGPFDDPQSWDTHIPVENSGFDGGFFDGRYVYYVPFNPRRCTRREASSTAQCCATTRPRRSTIQPTWDTHDASYTDGLHTTAYNAGAFDGRYFYTAPWRGDHDGNHAHGRVQRYDTLGQMARSPCATAMWATTATLRGRARSQFHRQHHRRRSQHCHSPNPRARRPSPRRGVRRARTSDSTSTAHSRPRVQLVAIHCNRQISP